MKDDKLVVVIVVHKRLRLPRALPSTVVCRISDTSKLNMVMNYSEQSAMLRDAGKFEFAVVTLFPEVGNMMLEEMTVGEIVRQTTSPPKEATTSSGSKRLLALPPSPQRVLANAPSADATSARLAIEDGNFETPKKRRTAEQELGGSEMISGQGRLEDQVEGSGEGDQTNSGNEGSNDEGEQVAGAALDECDESSIIPPPPSE